MKNCGRCGEYKSIDNFHKRGSGFQSVCKLCRSELDREIYRINSNKKQKNKDRCIQFTERLNAFKAVGCQCCGEKELVTLDFHHIEDNKEFPLAYAKRYSWDAVLLEVEKCVVVCANCHRKIHAGIINCPIV